MNAEGWHADNIAAAVYEPVTDDMISWAESKLEKDIPKDFVTFLKQSNGLYFRDLTFFGIASSLFSGSGLNRSQLEPQCITLANMDYFDEYLADPKLIMVGYIEAWDENTGLFMENSGDLFSIDSTGIKGLSSIEPQVNEMM